MAHIDISRAWPIERLQEILETTGRQILPLVMATALFGGGSLRTNRGSNECHTGLGIFTGRQQGSQMVTHVPFHITGRHAQERMRADPVFLPMMEGTYLQGIERLSPPSPDACRP